MSAVDLLRIAEEAGLTRVELAGAMHVAERTIFRWRDATTVMPPYLRWKLRAVVSNRLNARICYLADRYDEVQRMDLA